MPERLSKTESMRSLSGLYLVTDDGPGLARRVRLALQGGARAVQVRSKSPDAAERTARATEILSLCRQFRVPCIINDDLELALEIGAEGVHLGQEDGDPREARRRLGAERLLGISTHTGTEAAAAVAAGADYIGFGAMFPTASKEVSHLSGPEGLQQIRKDVPLPVVAIGGIGRDNAAEVIDAGADAIAVISSVLSSPAPDLAAAELSLLFNRKNPLPRGTVLTVAGSDSGGGAGIQADIKTVTLLGGYAAAVITAVTSQNSLGVRGIHPIPPSFVVEQLDAVLSDIPVDVVKIGMLHRGETVREVAAALRRHGRRFVVLDPVLLSKGGTHLLEPDGIAALKEELLPLAYLFTPNVPEAETLTGCAIGSEEEMRQAAVELHRMGARNVLLKGGHLSGEEALDLLFDGSSFHRFPAQRIPTPHTHGTGCTLASAAAALLAAGEALPQAVAGAKRFITAAIAGAGPLGAGHGPVHHLHAAKIIQK